jgi:hypothetical protein
MPPPRRHPGVDVRRARSPSSVIYRERIIDEDRSSRSVTILDEDRSKTPGSYDERVNPRMISPSKFLDTAPKKIDFGKITNEFGALTLNKFRSFDSQSDAFTSISSTISQDNTTGDCVKNATLLAEFARKHHNEPLMITDIKFSTLRASSSLQRDSMPSSRHLDADTYKVVPNARSGSYYFDDSQDHGGGFSFSDPESIFSEFLKGQAEMGGGDGFEDIFGGSRPSLGSGTSRPTSDDYDGQPIRGHIRRYPASPSSGWY